MIYARSISIAVNSDLDPLYLVAGIEVAKGKRIERPMEDILSYFLSRKSLANRIFNGFQSLPGENCARWGASVNGECCERKHDSVALHSEISSHLRSPSECKRIGFRCDRGEGKFNSGLNPVPEERPSRGIDPETTVSTVCVRCEDVSKWLISTTQTHSELEFNCPIL